MELALKKIIDGTEALFAQEYLNEIVINISSVIGMEYVFIARTTLDSGVSTTIAVAKNGALSENFEYLLKDTPCENVANGTICSYTDNVAKTFSKDQMLADKLIRGYVGSPLRDSKNNAIGIIVALSKTPIENSDFILTIMKVFSGRIAAELDRMDKELELKKINFELKELNDTLEDRIKFATIDLQEAQRLSKVGSWKFDATTNIFRCSDQVYEILGKDKSNILNLDDFFNILHVNTSNSEEIKEAYKNHLKNHTSNGVTYHIETDTGTKYIEERCETTFDYNGNPLVSNGTIQDITEEIQRNQLLVQQSRMAQMGEMVAMIAHQWRQPLGAISATSIDLNMQLELETYDFKREEGIEDCQAYFRNGLKDIDSFVQNLTTTIDDFRTFYKPNKKSSCVYFIEPINKALNMIKASFLSNGIEIIQTCTTCDKKVNIHSNELMQVILNILKNSQDNFREKEIKNPKVTIDCKCIGNNKVILKICDNGGGIEEDVLPKVFDPYFSTKSEKNGTGLGLYMSKVIIEEHHKGKLFVNNYDKGACFSIELVSENTGTCKS